MVLTALLAAWPPLVDLMGGDGRVASSRSTTCASARSGSRSPSIALAGQGYLRGVSDLRTPS